MVTRKPLPDNATPHPNAAPQTSTQDPRQDEWSATDSDSKESAQRQWETSEEQGQSSREHQFPGAFEDVPHTLKDGDQIRYGSAETDEQDNIWREEHSELHPTAHDELNMDVNKAPEAVFSEAGIARTETNPFKWKLSQSSGQDDVSVPPFPTETSPQPQSQSFSKLSLNESNKNPWRPALDEQKNPTTTTSYPGALDQDSGKDIWTSQEHAQASSTDPLTISPTFASLPCEVSCGWDEDPLQKAPTVRPSAPLISLEDEELEEDSHAWDDFGTQDKGKAPMPLHPGTTTAAEGANGDDWNIIDNEPAAEASTAQEAHEETPPCLRPRSQGQSVAQNPRPVVSGKTETYQVKNINWYDATAGQSLRSSPILIQNANGPCPLMALVNGLTLTTPASPQGSQDTVLVHMLKTREQISLDLLLDAVLDELMSERRISPDQSLPDIPELYAFLKGLHTGMNVNPRFTPTEETEKAFKRTSLTHLHPTERGSLIPGTFEDTQEMAFYRIFSIPLIHGWIPPKSDPVYDALARRAESYEDAQNLLFREEELEEKLSNPSHQGLTEEEQSIYQDVLTIKAFLNSSATQLTHWGLEVITKAMRPGSVAILFRNDHFSTLYRHPQTLQLLALVTDAGYSSHDEIVWESLADVNGERSEFYSGDFLVVGGNHQSQQGSVASGSASTAQNWSSNGDGRGQEKWSTVQNKRGKNKSQSDEGPPLSLKELEDRDLALAMQLQEEEDQRHRAEQAQRRRESQLSEQYIEQQHVRQGPQSLRQASGGVAVTGRRTQSTSAASGPPPTATNRGAAARAGAVRPTQQTVRPLVPPVVPRPQAVSRPGDDDDDAPPSYEHASKQPSYVPPAGHPAHPSSSPSTSMSNSPIPGSSILVSQPPRVPAAQRMVSASGFRRGSLRQGVPPAAVGGNSGSSGRDKDCVVM